MLNLSLEELTLIGLALALIEAAGLAAAGHAVLNARTSQGAIAWALSLVSMPYLALPLYGIFGRRRFAGYVQTRRADDQQIHRLAMAAVESCFAKHRQHPEGRKQFVLAMEKLAGMPFTGFNTVDLLIDGHSCFKAIFEAIETARNYILVQFFIVRDDDLGRELCTRLLQKQQQGVRVYFLYDSIGCYALPATYAEELKAAGAQVQAFRSSSGASNRFQINFRNHRKIVVVDGRIGFAGGHNVGIEYLGEHPRFGHWRDTHLRLEGPAVSGLQMTFLEDWFWITHDVPELAWHPEMGRKQESQILVIPTGPADEFDSCSLLFVQALHAARNRAWITSPYFVPNEAVIEALQLAALRGVDVRVMLPEKPDKRLVWLASFAYLQPAGQAGVKFYRYQKGFLHQKVMLIDDDVAAVGTANLDNRSFRLNFEITMLVVDKDFNTKVARMLETDFASCRLVDHSEAQRHSLPFRIGVASARLWSPVL